MEHFDSEGSQWGNNSSPGAGDEEKKAPQKFEKKNNSLPLWGNERTMNLNPLILTNIQSSHYFKDANLMTSLLSGRNPGVNVGGSVDEFFSLFLVESFYHVDYIFLSLSDDNEEMDAEEAAGSSHSDTYEAFQTAMNWLEMQPGGTATQIVLQTERCGCKET
uniref:Uncharacterized protein n=1 Tax=Timema shepardi TaxID=629360 RepID=A0A7R9AUB6_TIMSH|nr:unnamed protein product [Timema shepardi]